MKSKWMVGILRIVLALGQKTLAGSPPQEDGSNDASFLTHYVPAEMTAWQTYEVSITMLNTGTTAWTQGTAFALGSQHPQENTTWGTNRVNLPSSQGVSPG